MIESYPRRGDVYMADLTKDELSRLYGVRPVVIIQNNVGNKNSGMVILIPVTSRYRKKQPTHVPLGREHGLRRKSIALCENIHTVKKDCLLNRLGTIVGTDTEAKANDALKASLALE